MSQLFCAVSVHVILITTINISYPYTSTYSTAQYSTCAVPSVGVFCSILMHLLYIYVNCNWVVTRCNTHLHTNNTQNDTKQTIHSEECGPCPILASYTLAFALQLRKKHGKTVRVAVSKVYINNDKNTWTNNRIHRQQ
jgi:Ca2+/H+ antiporter